MLVGVAHNAGHGVHKLVGRAVHNVTRLSVQRVLLRHFDGVDICYLRFDSLEYNDNNIKVKL